MSIRFPRSCKTKSARSALARHAANARWQRIRAARPAPEFYVGYIEFGGPLAAGAPMRLDLVAVAGKRQWEAMSGSKPMQDLSERGVLRLVKTILRQPR